MNRLLIDIAAGAALLMIPSVALVGKPVWDTGVINFAICSTMALAYLSTTLLSTIWKSANAGWRLALALAPLPPIYLGLLLLPSPNYSRSLLLVSTAMYVFLQGIRSFPFLKHRIVTVAALVVVTIAFAANPGGGQARSVSSIINASHHNVEISEFDVGSLTGVRSSVSGGGIAFDKVSQEYLLVRPHGEIYRFRFGADDKRLALDDTGLRVPINYELFAADNMGKASADTFRVADVLILGGGADRRILVSHHYWRSDQSCFVVRLSQHATPESTKGESTSASDEGWTTLFESKPCLPIGLSRGATFAGKQIGGNIELAPTGKILFTVGDHQFDGWYRARNLVEEMTSEYGKVISIDPSTGDYEIFTTGHRNPQGLVVTNSGGIWATEHGPQGGDELNQLNAGQNYGYPFHSLGTEYGGVNWPPGNQTDNDSAIEVSPVYAWIPSIGISDLVEINGSDFPRWKGDLLIAALRDKAIWRVRTQEDRVLFAERIPVGRRVRDIVAANGGIVLWTDASTIMRISPLDDLDDGATLFTIRCGGCHDDYEDRIGPTLRGFRSRPVRSSSAYAYSPALRAIGGYWTESRLDDFLRAPNEFAPGTEMAGQGVEDAEERRKIIQYLSRL